MMMVMKMMMMMIYPSSSLCANIDPSIQHKPRSNCVAKLRSGTSEVLYGSNLCACQQLLQNCTQKQQENR